MTGVQTCALPIFDFAALNAGIDDRDDIFDSISRSASSRPQKSNTATFDVDLYGA